MNMNIPIALRTRNRPAYLDCTLKSVLSTNLPDDQQIFVIDDCSDTPDAKRYLSTVDQFVLEDKIAWPNTRDWQANVGKIMDINKLWGIGGLVEVVRPESRKGVRGGIFWCIDHMFTRFPNSDAVIVIEADSLFHRDWYSAIVNAYIQCKDLDGPNGDSLGLLSCYDRKGVQSEGAGWGWRSVKPLSGGRWGCGNGIGGVMYLVTRGFYGAAERVMKQSFDPNARAGDTMLQAQCGEHKFNIAVTKPSFCQHIGLDSTAWPEKGWRYTKNFRKPFAFEKITGDGFAYSEDWL